MAGNAIIYVKCESLMQFYASLNELHFMVGVLGSTKMQSAFSACYSEPGTWVPIYPIFKVFEKPNGAERREMQGERSESFYPISSITFIVIATNKNYLDFDVWAS